MPSNIFLEILDWSKSLKAWQNFALRLLLKKDRLSQEDFNQIITTVCEECGFETIQNNHDDKRLVPSDIPAAPQKGNRIQINCVKNLANVNAIVENQNLKFGKQLTVIFGDNGSGKSGYARKKSGSSLHFTLIN